MPNHDRRNLLWAAAALLVVALARPGTLTWGPLARVWDAVGGRRRPADRHPEPPADPGPRLTPPVGSVRRRG
jgi:hypothetical protein